MPKKRPEQPDSKPTSETTIASNHPKERLTVFESDFREDLRFWIDTDRKIALRIMTLVEAIVRDPFDGIGKPEPLRYLEPNTWSRRITDEHRLVYRVGGDRILFLQARFHYDR